MAEYIFDSQICIGKAKLPDGNSQAYMNSNAISNFS